MDRIGRQIIRGSICLKGLNQRCSLVILFMVRQLPQRVNAAIVGEIRRAGSELDLG